MADTTGVVISYRHDGRPKVRPAIRLAILALMLLALACGATESNRPGTLYPFCVEAGVPGIGPRPLSEQATLSEIGYQGPVGLMGYGIPGDPRDYLSRSLKIWHQWQIDPTVSK